MLVEHLIIYYNTAVVTNNNYMSNNFSGTFLAAPIAEKSDLSEKISKLVMLTVK